MRAKKKYALYEKQAQVVKAIAHPLRIAILDFLKGGEQCVCDIAEHVGSERSNVSRHLSVMVSAGVLGYRKEGLKVIYKLKTPCVLECLSCISDCLKQQAKESAKVLAAL
jgi:ArsR family transcriptional regulator